MAAEIIRYGTNARLTLEMDQSAIIAVCGRPRGEALDDAAAAVAARLVDPDGFPPLEEATVPGDRVAVVINHGVPQAAAVVAGVIQTLVEGRVAADDITIVLPSKEHEPTSITAQLPPAIRQKIAVHRHDPSDSADLAYLANSHDGHPILVNRCIVDADFVIPIGCMRTNAWTSSQQLPSDAAGCLGVFPSFADQATRERLLRTSIWGDGPQAAQLRRDLSEATWLLGASFTVQVIPGTGDSILHVLAGTFEAVAEQAQALVRAAWDFHVPQRAHLVVAAIEGEQQTWENVTRALQAAARVVEDSGTIAICSEIATPPLATRPSDEDVERMLGVGFDEAKLGLDALESQDIISEALPLDLADVRIYLLSQLDEDTVTGLGFGYVAQPHEISNLGRRHRDCIVISNAQHAFATPENEDIRLP